MGFLTEVLADFTPIRLTTLRSESRVLLESRRVRARWSDAPDRPLTPFELKEIHAHIRADWRATRSIEALRPGDRKWIPWVMCYPEGAKAQWLATDREFLAAYIDWLSKGTRTSRILVLLRAFLTQYPLELFTFDDWRQGLIRLIRYCRSPRLETWRHRISSFGHLQEEAPLGLAKAMLKSEGVEGLLSDAGLEGALRQSRYFKEALRAAALLVGADLTRGKSPEVGLERLREGLFVDGALAFQDLRADLAQSLLLPFAGRQPSPEVQQLLVNFFFQTHGDPRILPAMGWSGVADSAREVLLRWLVRSTIEDFLRLIRSTADKAHWTAREKFWRSFLEAGVISDAWIVLGRAARTRVGRDLRLSLGSFGSLVGQASSEQSVLLMRIDKVLLSEWSNSGACRAWSINNRLAPKLYQREYAATKLRQGENFSLRHAGSWEQSLGQYIYEQTGIRRVMSRSLR